MRDVTKARSAVSLPLLNATVILAVLCDPCSLILSLQSCLEWQWSDTGMWSCMQADVVVDGDGKAQACFSMSGRHPDHVCLLTRQGTCLLSPCCSVARSSLARGPAAGGRGLQDVTEPHTTLPDDSTAVYMPAIAWQLSFPRASLSIAAGECTCHLL